MRRHVRGEDNQIAIVVDKIAFRKEPFIRPEVVMIEMWL